MKPWNLISASVSAAVIFFLSVSAIPVAMAAIIEHTFVVSQMNMTNLCKETLVTVVNGQLPGPAIEVREGDSVAAHIVNRSPYNITIHWHGVRQWMNCWYDGVPMITQRPILPNNNFTYRFNVSRQEGTLWWHAHVPFLRVTLHGALIIRPRDGAGSYPFPMPHREIPIMIGEWWEKDQAQVTRIIADGYDVDDVPSASTINGKLGDLYNCSGAVEGGYVLDVEPNKTYLLRVINAALFSEFYLKIAGHKLTVVAADANYVTPFTTDFIAIAPGETVDALLVADAPPGRYYMVALPNQASPPDPQIPERITRGTVQYSSNHNPANGTDTAAAVLISNHGNSKGNGGDVPVEPMMPDQHDTTTSFYFHGNLTSSLRHRRHSSQVPEQVDERLFIVLGLGSLCKNDHQYCKRGRINDISLVATMNNVSFHDPTTVAPLLEAHYSNTSMGTTRQLPDRPLRAFNFTDRSLIPFGGKEMQLEATSKATVLRRFRHGTTVELVFQSTAILQSDSNPMHLHGHDMFVLAHGLGNYDAARDVAKYNLVNPPLKNTVLVPNLGWAAVRFVANNPGVWYVHCHYEFHLSMGMAAVFVVADGPAADTSLPPPPTDFLTDGYDDNNLMPSELYLQTNQSEV